MSNQDISIPQRTGGEPEGKKPESSPLIFRLLIGVFLLSRALLLAGYVGTAPGRDRYFMAIFALIFGGVALYLTVSAIIRIKRGGKL